MLGQPVTIYEVVPAPTTQTTITDVAVGAASVVLALIGVALVLGLVCAGVLVGVRRARRKQNTDDEGGDSDATRLGLSSS